MPTRDPVKRRAKWLRYDHAHPERRRDRHRRKTVERSPSPYRLGRYVTLDGEGAYPDEASTADPRTQRYVLLSAFNGDREETLWDDAGLHTVPIFEWLLALPQRLGPAIFVGFHLNYDVEHWLVDLDESRMRKFTTPRFRNSGVWFGPYQARWVRGKWFELWRCPHGAHVHRRGCFRSDRGAAYVRIEDVGSNFQGMNFENVVDDWLGKERASAQLHEGKSQREKFLLSDREFVERYNSEENHLLWEVMREFWEARQALKIVSPHHYSPAVLSKDFLRQHDAKSRLAPRPADVSEAELRAYFGGRIECAQIGRAHRPIDFYDINSAYPAETAKLPDMSRGRWVRDRRYRPELSWSVYKVRFDFRDVRRRFYPFPVRTHEGVNFPPCGTTWVWAPELAAAFDCGDFPRGTVRVLKAWHFVPDDPDARPFAWVEELYERRRALKASDWDADRAIAAVLKLGLNAIYGAFAQRVALDRTKVPTYQQMAYAGLITSGTRALLYRLVRQAEESVVAVATDGVYLTEPIAPKVDEFLLEMEDGTLLPCPDLKSEFVAADLRWDRGTPKWVALALRSSALGELKVERFGDMTSVQSGVYRVRHADGCDCGKCFDGWEVHGRGWGGKQVPFDKIETEVWRQRLPTFVYFTKPRFVGSRLAIARGKFADRYNWELRPHTVSTCDAGRKRLPLPPPSTWTDGATPADRLFPTDPYGVGFTPWTESQPSRPRQPIEPIEEDEGEPETMEVEVVRRSPVSGTERQRLARLEGKDEPSHLVRHAPLGAAVHAIGEARDERLRRRRSQPIAEPIHPKEVARPQLRSEPQRHRVGDPPPRLHQVVDERALRLARLMEEAD